MPPGFSTPPPPPAEIPLPLPPAPAPQSSPVPGGSIPKGGGKLRKKKIGRRPSHSKKSVPVRVPLTGLSRPPKRRQGESSESSVSNMHQDDSDSDSDVNPRRHGNMSAFIEARIQEALAGSGYIKESVFQQAMVECQQDQSQRMAALERQRASNAGECPLMDCLFQSNKL